MLQLLIIFISYLSYLLLWAIICLLAFLLSLALKKPTIMAAIGSLSVIVYGILEFLIGIGILIYLGSLLISGQGVWFLIMVLIGVGIVTWLLSLLQMPFLAIPIYFSDKMERNNREEEVVKAEVIDSKGNIIATTESEKDINKKLAVYFLISFGINFISIILNMSAYPSFSRGDYLIWPFFWLISQILLFGFIIGVYYKIRKGRFFFPSKKLFLVTTLKVTSIILTILGSLFLLIGIWKLP